MNGVVEVWTIRLEYGAAPVCLTAEFMM